MTRSGNAITGPAVVAEYTLHNIHKPIGVAEYRLNEHFPEVLWAALPNVEGREQQLSEELGAISADKPGL